jgi:adenylylsulfate kinase
MRSCDDTHQRSVLKALSWRMIATTATMSIVFAFTGKLGLSTSVGVVEVIVKMSLYYLHERLWGSIAFGRQET